MRRILGGRLGRHAERSQPRGRRIHALLVGTKECLRALRAVEPALQGRQARRNAGIVAGFHRRRQRVERREHICRVAALRNRLAIKRDGDGPARSDLERQATVLGLVDRVHFTGLRAREQVLALIAGFDIALQPRVVEYASPLKIFEYMAAGRAIVAPDQENIREVLRDGETALLFDPARPEAMWQAILRLARSAALRQRLGSAARAEIVRRDYTCAGNARRVVGLAHQSGRRGVPTS